MTSFLGVLLEQKESYFSFDLEPSCPLCQGHTETRSESELSCSMAINGRKISQKVITMGSMPQRVSVPVKGNTLNDTKKCHHEQKPAATLHSTHKDSDTGITK